MSRGSAPVAELGLRSGDHVCALYSGQRSRDEVVAGFIAEGLRAGDRAVCFLDDHAGVLEQVPRDVAGENIVFHSAKDAYDPLGGFDLHSHIRRLDSMARGAFAEGYPYFRAIGEASFVLADAAEIDRKEWFAYEAELNEFAPKHPQYLACIYDLDRFDGAHVLSILQTHPRILLDGLIIENPYYVRPREFLARL